MGGNWYGITYQYLYGLEGEIWARKRHYVKWPDCIPDDYTSSVTRPPLHLQPGKSVRLIMIPGEPASALPEASMRAMTGSISKREYIILPKETVRSCLNAIETASMFWWFYVALTGGLLYALLPDEKNAALVALWGSVSMFVITFLLWGPPMAYYCYRCTYQEIAFGGEQERSTN